MIFFVNSAKCSKSAGSQVDVKTTYKFLVQDNPSLCPPPAAYHETSILVMERMKQLTSHLSQGLAALQGNSLNDVVITMAIRSPMCKARKGGFKDARFVYTRVQNERMTDIDVGA